MKKINPLNVNLIKKKTFVTLKKFITNLYVLIFLYGFFLALFINYKEHEIYVSTVFDSLSANLLKNVSSHNEDSIVIKALNTTYFLLKSREPFFNNESKTNIVTADFYSSAIEDLISSPGYCGSYTNVLARLLQDMHFSVRIAQMKVGEKNGGHIIMEVLTRKGWVVLDPYYDLYFKNPLGNLASFNDVSSNWKFYKHQIPVSYDLSYNYKGVSYTNWKKIPVIMPLIKDVLDLIVGKRKADEISLRPYFLSTSKVYSNALFFILLILSGYIILLRKRKLIFSVFKQSFIAYSSYKIKSKSIVTRS